MSARKVCLIGIDGLRIDVATRPGVAPNLAGFISGGAMAEMTMEVPTISGPGWTSILTGTGHAEHGVVDNTFVGHRLHDLPDLLSLAFFADPRRTTYAATGWPPLADPAGPGPVIATRPEQQRAGRHRLVVRDGETYGYRRADAEVTDFSVAALGWGGADASFVYLGEVDEAGHVYGAAAPEYLQAIARVDAHLGALLAAVHRRAVAADEDWLVGVTTDHGHLDGGGHGGGEPEVTRSFLAVRRYPDAGPGDRIGLPAELRPRDVAGTLLAHLADDGPAAGT